MPGKHISVAVTNDLLTDQRVHKVCTYLCEKGNTVTLIGRKRKNSTELPARAYKTVRMRLLLEKGAFFYAFFNLRLFFRLLFSKSDIIVSNDLDTLLACRMASRLKRIPLVYDTHEYFTEVPELVNRPRVRRIWERIEERIFPKLEHIITVNESIADMYHKKYGKTIHVVRNIPSIKTGNEKKSRQELHLPEDKTILIIQGAGINIDRGNEEMVMAMEHLSNCLLLIIGNGDVVEDLKKLSQQLQLQDRILFFPRMEYSELMQYTRNSDIGITLDKDSNLNYKFSLPNKLFDFIHAGIPVLASDLPEVKRITLGYKTGHIVSSHDPKTIAAAIKKMMDDPKEMEAMRNNTKTAALDLTWEKECETLNKIYRALGAV
ncbi:MAG TPA: glycosyltransferase [Flavobacteriales bacterium]|nr:glycosyltransferase [Flavobacteriales bacterium]HRE73971.1 glycosyltransferase [Flavobacteriales bacterium]HRE96633.1 glycosyltransferase [Flavobacteriales bacterium]HRJ39542.1 glycosyltransferase [Flavobacteriales bacterium]